MTLTTGSMTAHHCHMHATEPAINWSRLLVSQIVHQPQVYDVRFPRTMKKCPCPFPPGHLERPALSLQQAALGDWISILEEQPNPFPRCERCGSQVPAGRLINCYYLLEKYKQGEERRLRHEALQRCFEASRVSFQINTETIPPSEAFP